MSDSNPISRRPSDVDDRLVDFLAAFATGFALCLCFFLTSPNMIHLLPDLGIASAMIGSFIVAAAVILPWGHPLRARWGWAAIAVLGVVLTLSSLAAMDWFTGAGDCACGETPPSDVIIAMMLLPPALIFMGAAHYLGLLVARKRPKGV